MAIVAAHPAAHRRWRLRQLRSGSARSAHRSPSGRPPMRTPRRVHQGLAEPGFAARQSMVTTPEPPLVEPVETNLCRQDRGYRLRRDSLCTQGIRPENCQWSLLEFLHDEPSGRHLQHLGCGQRSGRAGGDPPRGAFTGRHVVGGARRRRADGHGGRGRGVEVDPGRPGARRRTRARGQRRGEAARLGVDPGLRDPRARRAQGHRARDGATRSGSRRAGAGAGRVRQWPTAGCPRARPGHRTRRRRAARQAPRFEPAVCRCCSPTRRSSTPPS